MAEIAPRLTPDVPMQSSAALMLPPLNAGGTSTSPMMGSAQDWELIKQMVSDQIKTETHKMPVHKDSQCYPDDYNFIRYPSTYYLSHFTLFNGTGNPEQHLMHFKVACGDTICDQRLLLRQFSKSLSETAIDWYLRLAPGSMKTFSQLEEAFRKRFDCGETDKVTLQQLAEMRPNDKEKGSDFIQRWRIANMKCDQPIEEQQAISLLISKLEPVVRVFVRIDKNTTFSSFIPDVTRAEKNAPDLIQGLQSMVELKGEPSRNKQQSKGKPPAAAMSADAQAPSPSAPAPQRGRPTQEGRN